MKIYDILESLTEGPNDPAIFKAIFLAGGPGSGKSYVASKILSGQGLRPVNSDDVYEYLAQKKDMDIGDPEVIASVDGQEVRQHAKHISDKRQKHLIDGRIGLIIDGTGKDVTKVKEQSEALRKLGYETMMVYVNTSLDVAQTRNTQRKRKLPADLVTNMWNKLQNNLMGFQQIFGASNFHVVDNSGGLEDPSRAENFDKVYKSVRAFIASPVKARIATKWIEDQHQSKKTT